MTSIDEEKRNEKMVTLLTKLKKVHDFYQKANEETKAKLFDNCEFIFDELVELGMERVFVETLLIGGKDFIESFFKEERNLGTYGTAKVIFG